MAQSSITNALTVSAEEWLVSVALHTGLATILTINAEWISSTTIISASEWLLNWASISGLASLIAISALTIWTYHTSILATETYVEALL